MNLLSQEQLCRDWIKGLSGRDFFARVVEVRNRLFALSDAQKSQGAIICSEDPIAFSAAFFGAISIGFPVVTANPKWGPREWFELSQLINPGIVLGEIPFEGLDALRGRTGGASEKSVDQMVDGVIPGSGKLDPGFILIPTGGSTGGLKLAIHNWSHLLAASEGVQAFLGGGPIHSACLLPLYHVSGLMQVIRSFVSGGHIRFDDSILNGYCLSLVPTQIQRAIQSNDNIRKLRTTRAIFIGGGPLSPDLAQKLCELKLPVMPVYGMTETAAMCAAVPMEDFLAHKSTGAIPIGDSKFGIEKDGHIRIQSSALFQGYYGRLPVDLSEGYLTDDWGHQDSLGRLHVEGRMSRIIITGGEKVDPLELESILSERPEIEAALVVGVPDAEWGEQVVAFIRKKEEQYDIKDLKKRLSAEVAAYKIPKKLIPVSKLPFDDKGKVDHAGVRRRIREFCE